MTTAVIALAVIAALELAVIALLVWVRRDETRGVVQLADGLARRIQAPQLAAIETANEGEHSPLYAPPALMPDDDEAFWESREQLAERAMRQEAGGRDG